VRVRDETDDGRRGKRDDPVHGRDDEEPHAVATPGTGVARSDGVGGVVCRCPSPTAPNAGTARAS